VTLRVNGRQRVEIAAGQTVSFSATIDVPPGTGSVVGADWDFDGKGEFPASSPVGRHARHVTVSTTHRFDKPGTYFVALRGVSQRQSDPNTPYARVRNLDRVRVVVR
jgi:hypothetical protein